jgi:hypothetical protein
MDIWGVLVQVLKSIAVSLLLIVLGWTGIERGRIHHQLRGSRKSAAVPVGGWRAERLIRHRFRSGRYPRRIHLVISVIAGWM